MQSAIENRCKRNGFESWLGQVKKRFLTPREAFESHVLPVQAWQARAAGTKQVRVDVMPHPAAVKAAGNAMNVPCIAAAILASMLAFSKI